MPQIDQTVLAKNWVHAHEEDSAERIVYRPETFDLPPSRGRGGIQLNPDGTLVRFGPGPTDKTATNDGRWEIKEGDRLALYPSNSDKPLSVMKIEFLAPDRLVLQRKPGSESDS